MTVIKLNVQNVTIQDNLEILVNDVTTREFLESVRDEWVEREGAGPDDPRRDRSFGQYLVDQMGATVLMDVTPAESPENRVM